MNGYKRISARAIETLGASALIVTAILLAGLFLIIGVVHYQIGNHVVGILCALGGPIHVFNLLQETMQDFRRLFKQ